MEPSGRVYLRKRPVELAAVLDAASTRDGRRTWLLSDEPYRRIRFDGIGFTSPAECYPWTLIDWPVPPDGPLAAAPRFFRHASVISC